MGHARARLRAIGKHVQPNFPAIGPVFFLPLVCLWLLNGQLGSCNNP